MREQPNKTSNGWAVAPGAVHLARGYMIEKATLWRALLFRCMRLSMPAPGGHVHENVVVVIALFSATPLRGLFLSNVELSFSPPPSPPPIPLPSPPYEIFPWARVCFLYSLIFSASKNKTKQNLKSTGPVLFSYLLLTIHFHVW